MKISILFSYIETTMNYHHFIVKLKIYNAQRSLYGSVIKAESDMLHVLEMGKMFWNLKVVQGLVNVLKFLKSLK